MPSRWYALPILLLTANGALAQPPAPDKAQMLNATLRGWEQAMAKLDRFSVKCRRMTTDKTFGSVETSTGSARFRRGAAGQPSQAYLKVASSKMQYEELLYTGRELYVWLPATKVLQIHPMPPPRVGQPVIDDNIVALLFGVTAAAARQRYQMEWLPDPDPRKAYHYIRILPQRATDKAEFSEAQLSLSAKDFLPCRISYFQPNGNVVQWDFTELKQNDASGVTAASFAPPQKLPPGWRVDRMAPSAAASPAAPKR